MAKADLASMSVNALLKLREDVEKVLTSRAQELRNQLARLSHEIGPRSRESSLKGRKVAVKYRDKSGHTWAGRGAQAVWLREKLKHGAKLEDFAVHKNAGRVKPRRRCSTARLFFRSSKVILDTFSTPAITSSREPSAEF